MDELILELGGCVKLELVQLPAGTFMMGSPLTEPGRNPDEARHEVTLSRPFYMGKYAVLQEQYEAVTGHNPSYFKNAKNPVEMVLFEDAQAFCEKLSAKVGRLMRLPTEAEWEYACRAGTQTEYCSGDGLEALKKTGWCSYDGDWGSARQIKAAGTLQPNAWGLYDMHGNLWEWCQDWYDERYFSQSPGAVRLDSQAVLSGPPQKDIDPQGPQTGVIRVLRGGSWYFDPEFCRSASRIGGRLDLKDSNCGFRVATNG
jgi:formylglycine-generating enzyme required for sulfatase activity